MSSGWLAAKNPPPNILWISWEDAGPHFGSYGDTYAHTPVIDQLAEEWVLYTHCFSHSSVSAPSRAGLITGMYPSSIGSQHMRCRGVPPPEVRLFPEYLRRAGYYCSNDALTDYQMGFLAEAVWDKTGPGARWEGRAPGQPFFSVINLTSTQEKHLHEREPLTHRSHVVSGPGLHDPAQAPVPPYYPDTDIVRQDIARYYDHMSIADQQTGQILQALADAGLAENTIVFFWGDHGAGLTRHKRWIYDSGIHVPLLIRIPEPYRNMLYPGNAQRLEPGSQIDDLVALVDFAPTILSICGIKIPSYMQGKAFLGPQRATKAREYIYAGRDRLDEAYDLIRAVRDDRFKYIRNFLPHLPYAQPMNQMEPLPTLQEMRRLHAAGELKGPQRLFFAKEKPLEELYDTRKDPHEIHNLAQDPRYLPILERMRLELQRWQAESVDIGLIPESELDRVRWPNGFWQQTAAPSFEPQGLVFLDGKALVGLSCQTEGASMVYRYQDEPQSAWRAYSQAVLLEPGRILLAKAGRLGYYPSPEASYLLGEGVKSAPEAPKEYPHWKQTLLQTDLMDKAIKLKAWDGKGRESLAIYYTSLGSEHTTIRYWAVMGIRQESKAAGQIRKGIEALRGMLSDDAPCVRIAAARGLYQWGIIQPCVHALRRELSHPLESVRLEAALALDQLGDAAREALPFPKIPPGTEEQYSHQVYIRMYRKWGLEVR